MRFENVVAFCALVFVAACTSKPASKPPNPKSNGEAVRIGTYHAPSLVLAWYRSGEYAKELGALKAARDAAAKSGDEKAVAGYEQRGASQQDLAHRQLAGETGTEDILARLKDDLPAIAKAAGVERIVPPGTASGDRVVLVDVTDALVERFHPDEATKKMIAEVRKEPGGVHVH
jgi:hypothetical protein